MDERADDYAMKVREHRSTLKDSMATVAEVRTRAEFLQLLRERLGDDNILPHMVKVEYYCWDTRIKWGTWIIKVDGHGVFGFADGNPVTEWELGPIENWPLRMTETFEKGRAAVYTHLRRLVRHGRRN
jgi:hypothetical protein